MPLPMTLTVVYDNVPLDARLKTAWGYAAVVETGETTLLFDTGGDGPTLMHNLQALGIDPRAISAVVLSHNHADHTGGLEAMVAANPHLAVHAPRAFGAAIKARVAGRARVVETGGDTRIAARARVVGVLGGTIVEQALVLELGQEAAIVTGCAHPGIVEVVRRARRADPVGLIAGGFHLKDAGERDVANTTAALRELGVRRAAPSHCTGERAMRAFQQAFGSGFIPSGAGAVIQLPHVDLPPGGPP